MEVLLYCIIYFNYFKSMSEMDMCPGCVVQQKTRFYSKTVFTQSPKSLIYTCINKAYILCNMYLFIHPDLYFRLSNKVMKKKSLFLLLTFSFNFYFAYYYQSYDQIFGVWAALTHKQAKVENELYQLKTSLFIAFTPQDNIYTSVL